MIPGAPADSLQAVIDSVFTAPKYDWVTVVHPWRWLLDRFARLVERLEALRLGAPLAYWTIVVVALVILVAILVHAGWLVVQTTRHAAPPDARAAAQRGERRDAAWYRRRAAALAGEGRYPEAMRATFEGTILDLAAAGAVRWHPSKTPREYLREARLPEPARGRLAVVVDTLYAASFAGRRLDRPAYESWRTEAQGGWGAP